MNSLEGQIKIDLLANSGKGPNVKTTASRPLQASRVLIGKSPEEALAIIPLLFSICGIAQTRAAQLSMHTGMAWRTDNIVESHRDMLVLVETAKEHLLRVFLEWPGLFGIEPADIDLTYLAQLVNNFKTALFKQGAAFTAQSKAAIVPQTASGLIEKLEQFLVDHVFGMTLQDWQKITELQDLKNWSTQCESIAAQTTAIIYQRDWAGQGLTDCKYLPPLNPDNLFEKFAAINADTFIAEPQWQGECQETGALARQYGHPLIRSLHSQFQTSLITRWLARLVELAGIPRRLRQLLQLTGNEIPVSIVASTGRRGLAQVEAARGRLIHCVEIEQGVINNYQILAPTEWNFHPQGLIAQALKRLVCDDKEELEQLACLVINAVDPCVGFQLKIH